MVCTSHLQKIKKPILPRYLLNNKVQGKFDPHTLCEISVRARIEPLSYTNNNLSILIGFVTGTGLIMLIIFYKNYNFCYLAAQSIQTLLISNLSFRRWRQWAAEQAIAAGTTDKYRTQHKSPSGKFECHSQQHTRGERRWCGDAKRIVRRRW